MMGASLCVRNHGHAVVSVLNDSLRNKPKAQAIHSVAVQILIMIGAAVLAVSDTHLDVYKRQSKKRAASGTYRADQEYNQDTSGFLSDLSHIALQ